MKLLQITAVSKTIIHLSQQWINATFFVWYMKKPVADKRY